MLDKLCEEITRREGFDFYCIKKNCLHFSQGKNGEIVCAVEKIKPLTKPKKIKATNLELF